MRYFTFFIFALTLISCRVQRNLSIYQSTENKQANKVDYQIKLKIIKDYEQHILPFVFLEKSGRSNNWLVSGSFTTFHNELQSIFMNLTITNLRDEVLFKIDKRKIDLIEFDGYRAKNFDFGSFEIEMPSKLQDTLKAFYEISFQKKTIQQSVTDSLYLFFNKDKRSGSFF